MRGITRRTSNVLVLVWHRVDPSGPAEHEIVRSLPSDVFDRQLSELGDLGTFCSLQDIAHGTDACDGPAIVVTFDDDWGGYVEHVLPVLQSHGVSATFFLSGRTLGGLGPTWWEALEHEIRTDGVVRVAGRLGLTAKSPSELARQVQGTDLSRQIEERHAERGSTMSTQAIGELRDAGMTIGFHTRGHLDLATLSGAELARELTTGRNDLAKIAGQPVDLLAYPHGRTNPAVQRAARQSGFARAFGSDGKAHRRDALPFEMSRWEPIESAGASFRSQVAARLLNAR